MKKENLMFTSVMVVTALFTLILPTDFWKATVFIMGCLVFMGYSIFVPKPVNSNPPDLPDLGYREFLERT